MQGLFSEGVLINVYSIPEILIRHRRSNLIAHGERECLEYSDKPSLNTLVALLRIPSTQAAGFGNELLSFEILLRNPTEPDQCEDGQKNSCQDQDQVHHELYPPLVVTCIQSGCQHYCLNALDD